ncbi:MAG: cytochrome c oxidase accessory protein CcoG [Kiritimatiellae bacterium]|nr:cytochrome c oxidase accessory protein CcoG [Kiritimatiellia bacterium]MDW8458326.1 cytochrome c oxidase accessory protein CcoG [Verrucomicrobiota bacterium]
MSSAIPAVDYGDFRNQIPTADRLGRRIWIYPRKPAGRFYRWRTWVSWLLLGIFAAGPFIRIDGVPLLLFDIPERKFALFGQIFWPQDLYIFALLLLTIFVMIVLFTAVFGRIWCGWACPQTIFMEMVFRKIEHAIEGDGPRQRAFDASPWTPQKIAKKTLKHGIFLLVSWVAANWLSTYFVGLDDWWAFISGTPFQQPGALIALILFTLLFYGIFARFREQACTFICPYGRLQSVLLDNDSLIVAYDHRRGEARGRFSKGQTREQRREAGIGDCIDCGLCVDVCPTGIDIRNGLQMECVHCTACIDACDSVMDRLRFPRGLIRYASQRNIAEGRPFRPNARMALYTILLLALTGVLAGILITRDNVETQILRAPGSMFQEMPGGEIGNLFLVKVVNKTPREIPVDLRIESPPDARLTLAGGALVAPREGLAQSAAVISAPRGRFIDGNLPIEIGVYENGERVRVRKTNLVGPATP